MTNLVSHLEAVVRDHPGETALSVADTETTYRRLWAMTGRFAAGLVERGVEPGDAVALYLPNLPQFVVAFYGTLRAGGVVVPVDPDHGSEEIRPLLADSAAGAVVTTTDRVPEIEAVHGDTDVRFIVTADGEGEFATGFADFLDTDATFDFWDLAERDDDDVAVLSYTPGTTGDPKGVELGHGSLAANARATADLVPGGIGPGGRALAALPLSQPYGLTAVLNATLLGGGTVHPMAGWDAERALRLLDEAEIDVFHGTPEMYEDLLASPAAEDADLSSLRLAGVLGGVSPALLDDFEAAFGVPVRVGYGLTEAPVTHFDAPDEERRVGSVGKPLPDVEARVVDDEFEPVDPVEEGPIDGTELDDVTGELVVSGPNVMRGYHDLPEADEAAFTEAEGVSTSEASGGSSDERGESDGERWLHTGAVAYHDEDGHFYVVGREADGDGTGGVDAGAIETDATADEDGGTATDDAERNDAVADEDDADDADEAAEGEPATTAVSPAAATEDVSGPVAEEDTGTPADGPPDGIEKISGVGPAKGETLRAAGFESVEDVRAASHEELAGVEGIGDALAEQIKADVEGDD